MTLSGCSWRPQEPRTEVETIYFTLPDSLMSHFCEFQPPGNTVGSLGNAYVANTNCGKKYQEQVVEQKTYFKKLKENRNGQ